jgi:LacI family transcriptional regulator
MVTLKYIAKKAGVSLQTVSNVVNNKDSEISQLTKERVLKLIKEHNYKPSKIARSLRRGKSKTIGLLVPDIAFYPTYPIAFDFIESRLAKEGFNVLLFNTREELSREVAAINSLIENKVDGIIFIRIIENNPHVDKIPTSIPIVACLRGFDYFSVPSVLTNNFKVGELATEHLIKNGHSQIIHLAGNQNLLAHRDRRNGYIATMKKYNLEVKDEFVNSFDYKDKNLSEPLKNFFKNLKDFTAVFAYADIVALQCMKALKEIGRRIPEDVSIVGVDNLYVDDFVSPSLTSIEQPIEQICNLSVDLLIQLIAGYGHGPEDIEQKAIICEPEFIERQSVKKIYSKIK